MSLIFHPRTTAALAAARRQPARSLIFHGPAGLGKATAARELAAQLNCLDGRPDITPNASACTACRQIAAGTFPDLIMLDRAGKASLGIEPVRSLVASLGLRPYRGQGTRVVIINDAHLLTTEAQNALLKLLEEPPPATLIILVTASPGALLVTVRSRCQAVHFIPPPKAAVADLLVSKHGLSRQAATELTAASSGAPGLAVTLAAHPDRAEALTAFTRTADSLATIRPFERLLLAARLATADPAELDHLTATFHRQIVAATKATALEPTVAAIQLSALERFREHLQAKVAPRVALECLMLELG